MGFIAIILVCQGLIYSCLTAPTQTMSFQQDNIGQYSFSYNEPMSVRSEYRSSDGITRGIYSYIDVNGNLQTSEYEAGPNLGFLVKATNLPEAPLPIQETPEILAARQKHLQLLEEANRQEERDRAMSGIKQDMLIVLDSHDRSGERPKKDELTENFRKLHEQSEIKKGSQNVFNQQLQNESPENSRSNAPIPSEPTTPGINERSLAVSEFGNRSIKDISRSNSFPSPKDNIHRLISSLTDISQNLILPKGNPNNFSSLMNEEKLVPLPKIDATMSKCETNLLSLVKEDAHVLPLPNNDTNQSPLPKCETLKSGSVVSPPGFPYNPSKQRDAVILREPVKNTPEVLTVREAQFLPVAESEAAMSIEYPKYTTEVQAAREAHFRAYELAAKLAAESDANPKILEQLLGRAGDPKLGTQKIEKLVSAIASDKSAEEIKQLMRLGNVIMNNEVLEKKTNGSKKTLPQASVNKGINNLSEKTQLEDALKSPEISLGTGITPASTSLRIPDVRLSSFNEFEQSKLKAGVYSVPIEISHVPETDILSIVYT